MTPTASQAEICVIDGTPVDAESGLCLNSCQPADRDQWLAEGFAPYGQGCALDDTPFGEDGRCAAAGHTREESAAYDAWTAKLEAQCGAQYSTSGPDPYGTECDLPADHTRATLLDGTPDRDARKHEGDDPVAMRVGYRVRWLGGGSCAGDPIAAREVEHIRPDCAAIPDAGLLAHLRDEHLWNMSGIEADDYSTLRAMHRVALDNAAACL